MTATFTRLSWRTLRILRVVNDDPLLNASIDQPSHDGGHAGRRQRACHDTPRRRRTLTDGRTEHAEGRTDSGANGDTVPQGIAPCHSNAPNVTGLKLPWRTCDLHLQQSARNAANGGRPSLPVISVRYTRSPGCNVPTRLSKVAPVVCPDATLPMTARSIGTQATRPAQTNSHHSLLFLSTLVQRDNLK